MTITAVQTVTIPVADQDVALAFYTGVLGFEVRADNAYGDARWLTVAPVGASAGDSRPSSPTPTATASCCGRPRF